MIDPISAQSERAGEFERAILTDNDQRKRIARSIFDNAGIFMGVLLMFGVILVITTDIHLLSLDEVKLWGVEFLILLFASYSMYINCSDSGSKNGLHSGTYRTGITTYEELKKAVIEHGVQGRLPDFCRYYIESELKAHRTSILAVVGISYEVYAIQYVGRDEDDINHDPSLTKSQRRAVIRANRSSPVRLTPEMIMQRGRSGGRRAPLGMSPENKKLLTFIVKFITSAFTALMLGLIVMEAVTDPTWDVISACCIKLVTISLNGFNGYKFGYENIVLDTVKYMEDQSDLMRQAMVFCGIDFRKEGDDNEKVTNDLVSHQAGTGVRAR